MGEPHRLVVGDHAPDFEAEALSGERVSLAGCRGSRLWLAFFRYAACPLCNLRVQAMIRRYDGLSAAGLHMVAVFQSPRASLEQHVGRQQPPFPLVSDPQERLYRLFGVRKSLGGMLRPRVVGQLAVAAAHGFLPGAVEGSVSRIPADFLIDEHSVLRDIFYGSDIADHIPFDNVETFALQPPFAGARAEEEGGLLAREPGP